VVKRCALTVIGVSLFAVLFLPASTALVLADEPGSPVVVVDSNAVSADDPTATAAWEEPAAQDDVVAAGVPPTVVQVYCQIPNVNQQDQRIVGAFVDARTGFGDPTVTFALFDLNGTQITAPTGSAPLPATNPVAASAPYPNNWQWGPGGYSKLTVTAVYPSLDLGSYPDETTSLTITCVPATPTPTPTATFTPTATPLVSPTPIPTRTPVGYSPVFTSIMKDSEGNTILDGDTVAAGTTVYDIAVISGLPPNSTGSVYYWLLNECSFVSTYGSGWHPFVADGNGNVTAPQSADFLVPVSPGGHYDWLVGFMNDDYPPFYLSGCGPETFYVVPPPTPTATLTPFGDGNALIACFAREPVVPGTAGYKINVNPLPSTGSVEVNVTLQRTDNTNEYTTVTLPPGLAKDLEFYGPYKYAWANLIYRDANGGIYAVVNLSGECSVAPGPTYTPSPTFTPSPMPTMTWTATISSSPTVTPIFSATLTPTSTLTPIITSSPTLSPTIDPASEATSEPTSTPEPTKTPLPVMLPNTGSGSGGGSNVAMILVAFAVAAGLMIRLTRRAPASSR
jgi:hypothetical protein